MASRSGAFRARISAGRIDVSKASIDLWASDPAEAPMQYAELAAEAITVKAKQYVGRASWELYKSITSFRTANQYGGNGHIVTAGGTAGTKNSKGVDYTMYHHNGTVKNYPNPFLTRAIQETNIGNITTYLV